MTSNEIEQMKATDLSTNSWLRLIAIHLCRMNESGIDVASVPYVEIEEIPTKRGPGRPRKQ